MATKNHIPQNNYGFPQPYAVGAPEPIITNRAPVAADKGLPGQMWVDVPAATVYVNAGTVNGLTTWTTNPTGALAVASMTVNPGNLVVQTGNLSVNGTSTLTGAVGMAGAATVGTTLAVGTDLTVGGDTALNGNLDVIGDVTITGDFDLTNTGITTLISTDNAAGAITLQTNGGAAETILLDAIQGTGADAINLFAQAGGITMTTGLATADAVNINAGAVGGIDIDYGTSGMVVTGANGAFTLQTGSGAIGIGTDAAAHTITLGNNILGTAVNTTAGTGGIALTATNSAIALATGTGAVNISADATANAVNVGTGAGAKTVVVGSVDTTSATTIACGTGACLIGASATDHSTTVGSVTGVAATTLRSGTGAMTFTAGGIFDANVTGAVTIDGTSLSLDGTLASNLTVTGAGIDLTCSSVGGSVVVTSNEAVATAVTISATDVAGGILIDAGTAGIKLDAAFVDMGGIYFYVGAGVPGNPLALHIGDIFVRTNAGAANERMYIATGVGAWTNVTCAA